MSNEIEKDPAVNAESASELIAQIRKKASAEAGEELKRAEAERAAILRKAKREAEQIESSLTEKAEKKTEMVRRRILSGVELQKKKAFLNARETLVQTVKDQVRKRLEKHRGSKAFEATLIRWIGEGVRAIASDKVIIHIAPGEKGVLSSDLLKKCTTEAKNYGLDVSFSIQESETDEGGVFLSSGDGRISYDNRFSARLTREEMEIRKRVNSLIETRKGKR